MLTTYPEMPETKTYLVVLNQVVVAMDLAEAISERHPGANVLRAWSTSDALSQISSLHRIALAFVGLDAVADTSSALVRAVTQRGGRFVVLGAEAADKVADAGWTALTEPFTTADVFAAVDHQAQLA